ncbi:MAG: ABC transporter ATP-binding protein [Pirellulales bacterium]
MQLLIQTVSLTKLYGVVLGLNDLTLNLPPGVHGLLGPNGAGKSTFLKLVMGLLKPTEGSIRVLGKRPWDNPRLLRLVGYCPEHDAFYHNLTGLEFVTVLARMGGFGRAEARRRAAEALGRVGAAEFMNRRIAGYSKGMRQRTRLAQALVHDPEFLVLDEPLSGLDPIGRHEIIELVRSLGSQGKSVLVSSHVLHEVQAVTDDFLLIYGGRLLASGNVHEIRSLMNQHPHQIKLRSAQAATLAHHLLRELPVTGIELDEKLQTLSVRTHDPQAFYAGLPLLVAGLGLPIDEVASDDDNLESVFKYLVGSDS